MGNIEIDKKYHYLKEKKTFIQTIQSNTAPNNNEYSNGKINIPNKLKCTNADVPNFEDTNWVASNYKLNNFRYNENQKSCQKEKCIYY